MFPSGNDDTKDSEMGNRLSRIVTRTGDDGTTGLSDGSRLPKDDALIEAMGTVDELNSVEGLPPLKEFILPGGSAAIASLHMARTVCRRAERRLLSMAEERTANGRIYLNRLSDLLFVASRIAGRGQERYWIKGGGSPAA
jgi:cob(I)alamin adenosyltransferase